MIAKRISLIAILLISILALASCKTGPQIGENPLEEKTETGSTEVAQSDNATAETTETVTLPDGATEDSDGFVRYPGEPSREDKSYYIIEEVCGQFTKKFIEGITGKTIVKTEPFTDNSTTYNCNYYTSDTDYLSLHLTYLTVANQKTGHEALGRTVKFDERIPKENMVVIQEDGLINEIYLVLSPDKYLSIIRSSGKAMTEEEVMDFAIKLGEKIKDFK